MKFKHYIWDFDGTLFDSYPHILRCFLDVLAEEGGSCDEEMLDRKFYVNFGEARRYAGISDEGYRRFGKLHYRMGEEELPPKVVPFPEIEGILSAIVEAGGDHYVYTNRNETARGYCRQYGLDKYIKGYVFGTDGFPGKPAPDALLALMEREGLSPEDCVMIGDREIDGLSGVNAGMAGVIVTTKTVDVNGNDPLAVSTMPYKCRKLRELLDIFEISKAE